MEKVKVDEKIFKFKYLPEYAEYLLKNKLEEFVTVGIRFAREVDLPMLKPLAKIPEKQLVELSIESNKQILNALINNSIGSFIQANLNNWMDNKLGIIDRFEIVAEDLTLAYHIRRKLFSYFLYGYTKSAPIQQLIVNEIDVYTSMEELISLKAFLELQKEVNTK